MSKLNNLNIALHVSHFSNAIGNQELEAQLVSDISSALGREEKNLKVTAGDWKMTAGFKLKSKDGNEIQLPLNNAAFVLLRFGMQLSDIAKALSGNADKPASIQADLPRECDAWITTKKEKMASRKETVKA